MLGAVSQNRIIIRTSQMDNARVCEGQRSMLDWHNARTEITS